MNELELEKTINLQKLGYEFLDKPVIVAGLATEYHDLRKHGDDIDFIVTDRDYQRLKVKFPNNRKDVWGDFGSLVDGFELFRSIDFLNGLTNEHTKQDCFEIARIMKQAAVVCISKR